MKALRFLRELLEDSEADFKSAHQEELLIESLLGDRDVLAILPTGAGKSICWEVPAQQYPSGISIIFTPFLSLINDQLLRAKTLGFSAIHWRRGMTIPDDTSLVFVSWENADQPELIQ